MFESTAYVHISKDSRKKLDSKTRNRAFWLVVGVSGRAIDSPFTRGFHLASGCILLNPDSNPFREVG